MSKNISEVGLNCTGCSACSQVCPSGCVDMLANNEGFMFPSVNDAECINCGKCLRICPESNPLKGVKPIKIYGLKNKDAVRIKNSASGGAADVISQFIISGDGIVFGAAYMDDLHVAHMEVTSADELYRLQSSKYVQSDLNNSYKKVADHLAQGRHVLFTGTPCQVAGLYASLDKLDMSRLYTIDLICHGVPSPLLFKKYIEFQEKRLGEKILSYNFRSKDKRGWGHQYLLKTKTKTKTKTLGLDKYGRHFLDGDCYRESCYLCKYASYMRVGDLTIGDFWGVEEVAPAFFSSDGVSVVLANTNKGIALVECVSKRVDLIGISLKDALLNQGNLVGPSKRPEGRNSFYEEIQVFSGIQYMDNLTVGLALKDRIKSCVPKRMLRLLKRLKPR